MGRAVAFAKLQDDFTIQLLDKPSFEAKLARVKPGNVRVIIENVREQRSLALNNFWHAIVITKFLEYGGEPLTKEAHERMHEFLKYELNSVTEVFEFNGQRREVRIARST